MIQCQACGTENPPDASYCSKCARKLDPETQQAVVQQRAQHVATGVNWSAVVVTAVVIIIVAAVVILFVTHVI